MKSAENLTALSIKVKKLILLPTNVCFTTKTVIVCFQSVALKITKTIKIFF